MLNEKIQISINKLRENNASGANELFIKTIDIIKNQMHLVQDKDEEIKDLFFDLAKEIINARPSMTPLINTIGYVINN